MKIKRVMNYEINDIEKGDNIALNIFVYHENITKIGLVSKILNDEITILTKESIEYTGKIADIDIEKTIELNSKDYLIQLEEIENILKRTLKIVDSRLNKIKDHFSIKGKYTVVKKINEIKDYLKITSLDHVIDKTSCTIDIIKTWHKE